jgi:acetoacetyl-CoA synthetase
MAMGAEGSIVQAEMAGRGYGEVLWAPSAEFKGNARVSAYCRWLASERGLRLADYGELWSWSVTELGEFWSSVWDYFGVLGNRGASPAVSGSMPQVSWFPGATLNYARNALRAARKTPEATAVIYRSEAGRNGTLTYAELEREVARAAAGLASLGVGAGDRVAAYLPNCPEALIGLLATASLGAVWSSCSPDFGVRSATDRFAQISPKVLIGCDGYVYGGKPFRREEQVAGIAAALPGLRAVITVEVLGQRGGPAGGRARGGGG